MQIRKLKSHAEYLAAEDLQRIVWHFPDRELIPLNELVVAQRIGGHVLGAFDKSKMAAFSFGIPGFEAGKSYHYSRMTGVMPAYQNSGLGYRLKLEQRRLVLAQGLDLIKWTFDPLQSRNAYFNVEKLGAVIDEYLVNIYGESGSQFNRGLPTDRFVPKWRIATKRVTDHLAGRAKPLIIDDPPACIDVTFDGKWPVPRRVRTGLRARTVTIEIPRDIDGLKAHDLKLAQRWRQVTRSAFQDCFGRGFQVTGFATDDRRSLYVLENK